jgi:helix-turn-helix protein
MSKLKLENVYKLSNTRDPGSVQLKSLEWAVLTQLDGSKSVAEVADVLAMTKEEIFPIFEKLIKEGVVEGVTVESKQVEYLSEDFFKEMEKILVLLIGPVASIIIDDVLFDMNKEKDNVEKDEAGALVEAVSAEINDSVKQLQFQQEMLKKLQEI